jgi:class 3 adenylate cyclase
MGLHFGTPHAAIKNPISLRMDVYGLMVNTSSRVQSVANGGQVAVSDQFLQEVWRLQTRREVMSLPLTKEKREEILIKEASAFSDFFALDLDPEKDGWCKLKGVKEKVYVTLVNCTPPEKSVRIIKQVS